MRRGLAAALAAVMVITAVPSAATAQESHFASRGEVVQLLQALLLHVLSSVSAEVLPSPTLPVHSALCGRIHFLSDHP